MEKSLIKLIFVSRSTDESKMTTLKEMPKEKKTVITQKYINSHKRNPFILIELNRLLSVISIRKMERKKILPL